MLRIRVLGTSLVALAAGAGAASAADIYAAPPVPSAVYSPVSAFNWTGAYIGAVGSYGWGTASSGGTSWDANGWGGGAYAGYNFQVNPNFVLGLEADITANDMNGVLGGFDVKNDWNATFRARAGMTFDRVMVYATGGVAGGGIKVNDGVTTDSKSAVGWTLGGGVEAAITNNVTTRLEYRYTDLGTHTFATTPSSVNFKSSQVLLGVGLKF